MNVLMIRTDYKVAGPGILTLKYSEVLKKKGHNVIACSSGGALISEFEKKGINHYKIDTLDIKRRSPVDLIKSIVEINKIIKKNEIDIIHGQNAVSTMLGWIASITVKRKIKVFNTVHGVGKESFLKLVPCKIIAVSEHVKQNLINKGIPKERIHVLHNGTIDLGIFDISRIDGKEIRESLGLDSSNIIVGCIAMFTGKKGHLNIIESISEVIKANEKVRFLFVGDGPYLEMCKELVESKGIESHVIFMGVRNDIPQICASMDILIHLPDYETFGIVLTEAMAMGKPVIARNVGGIPEVVEDGNTGILINDLDSKNISSIIIKLINDKKLRTKLGKNSLERVRRYFTIDNTIDNLIEIYTKK